MKKVKLLLLVLLCTFISGCNMKDKEKSMSLEEAYFYLLNKTETKEEPGIEEVKELLKDYKLDIVEHPKTSELENQKSYEYVFTDNTKTFLSVNFIVKEDEDTIDFIQYNVDNDELNLISTKGNEQWNYIIKYKKLDKAVYNKILGKLNEFDISVPRDENEYSLEDAYYYVIGEMSDNNEIKIEDIKKILKDYSFEEELIKDDPTINLKQYYYTFSNGDMESITVSTNVENNEEIFTGMMHFLGKYPKLVLHPEQEPEPAPENGEVTISISYDTSDKATYSKVFNIINDIK